MDLISSEAKPKISSALADFILASARISFLQEFEVIRENGAKKLFKVHKHKTTEFKSAVLFFDGIRILKLFQQINPILILYPINYDIITKIMTKKRKNK